METSESEPLMKYRKFPWTMSKSGDSPSSEMSLAVTDFGPDGIRYASGVTMFRALVGNVRTCRRDAKGERQVSGPHEAQRTDARHRGGAVCISGDDL
jgi:hypothetical protein